MLNLVHGFNNSGPEMAPVVGVGGLLCGSETALAYRLALGGDFVELPDRGLGDKEEMHGQLAESLLEKYDHLERPFVLYGYSLGSLLGEKYILDHPETVLSFVSFAGAREGVSEETVGVQALRLGIEMITGRKSQYEHILSGSDHMTEHRRAVQEKWQSRIKMHLVSPAHDLLFPLPQGLRAELPDGDQAETYVVGRTTEEVKAINGMPEQTVGMPHWWKPNHVSLLFHPLAKKILNNVRVEAAQASSDLLASGQELDLPLAA